MADQLRPAEAFALGKLHGILLEAGLSVSPLNGEDFDLFEDRGYDVYGLVPGGDNPICIRMTIEEVQ